MRILWGLFLDFRKKDISVYTAYAAFFLILSGFPALTLLLGLLRYTRLQPADLMELLEGFLPAPLEAEGWKLIRRGYENTSPLVLSASALATLWSAGKGFYGLMRGMNRIYDVQEQRGWFRTRLLCAVYMVFFLAALLLTLVLYVFGNTFARYWQIHGGDEVNWAVAALLRFLLLLGLQSGIFCLMMMYLPARNNGFGESLPGALLAGLGWMGVSEAFSVYVERFSGYGAIFGSVYGAALSMLWIYGCVMTVFAGAIVNHQLGKK